PRPPDPNTRGLWAPPCPASRKISSRRSARNVSRVTMSPLCDISPAATIQASRRSTDEEQVRKAIGGPSSCRYLGCLRPLDRAVEAIFRVPDRPGVGTGELRGWKSHNAPRPLPICPTAAPHVGLFFREPFESPGLGFAWSL